jgi:hypothetical protein
MEPEGLLPHSQLPATCPYPEPARSNPCPPTHFLMFHLVGGGGGGGTIGLKRRCADWARWPKREGRKKCQATKVMGVHLFMKYGTCPKATRLRAVPPGTRGSTPTGADIFFSSAVSTQVVKAHRTSRQMGMRSVLRSCWGMTRNNHTFHE